MFGYIYITTNLINGKKYIGKHKAAEWDPEYKGSGKILMQAFLKYGKENFECHILESVNNVNTICDNLLELNQSEKYYIDYYNCVADSYYYNMKRGGDGGCDHQTQTTKEKIGKYFNGKIAINLDGINKRIDPNSLDEYLKLGWKLGVADYTHTDSFKLKVSKTLTGYVGVHKGDKKTKIPANLLSQYLDNGYVIGWKDKPNKNENIIKEKRKFMMKDNVFKLVGESQWDEFLHDGWIFKARQQTYKRKTGYHLSQEHIQKLKVAHKGHKNSKDAIEKQAKKLRGRIAIMKDGIKKLIYSEDLAAYLDSGWSREIKHTDKRSRQVVCYETQQIYESITAATKDTGCNVKKVLKSKASSTSKGYHWYFNGDEERKSQIDNFLHFDK